MENNSLFIPFFAPKLTQTSSIGTVHRSQVIILLINDLPTLKQIVDENQISKGADNKLLWSIKKSKNYWTLETQAVARQLARWYDVEVVYMRPVPALSFTGKMERSLSLEDVLYILKQNEETTLTVGFYLPFLLLLIWLYWD